MVDADVVVVMRFCQREFDNSALVRWLPQGLFLGAVIVREL